VLNVTASLEWVLITACAVVQAVVKANSQSNGQQQILTAPRGFKTVKRILTKPRILGMSVLCKYAIATYFPYHCIFRIFQQSAHIAYFYLHKLAFNGNFNIICVSITYFH